MTASVSIITAVTQDVLTVPNSAVKAQNGAYYVETLPATATAGVGAATTQGVVSPVPPTRTPVQTGLANDTVTEITGGLTEGDMVVTRTITATTGTTASAPSLLNAVGARGATAAGATRAAGGATFRGN